MAANPPKLAEMLELLEMLGDRSERIQMLISVADRFREVPVRDLRPRALDGQVDGAHGDGVDGDQLGQEDRGLLRPIA